MQIKTVQNIADISPLAWNRVNNSDYPFLTHAFLAALESNGCCTERSGWQPNHFIVENELNGQVIATMPCYLKTHSYGEYVFDWAWADAYLRHNRQYYPKYLTAIPFTPSVGPRISFENSLDDHTKQSVFSAISESVAASAENTGASSWHTLFVDDESLKLFNGKMPNTTLPCRFIERNDCQYHWNNSHYRSFDDFLDQLTSRKRKNIRKERQKITDQGITLVHHSGAEITEQHLDVFYVFYQATYLKRGQRPYLSKSFFASLLENMPESLTICLAKYSGRYIAAAIFLHNQSTLFGRYWGCLDEFEFLHFEVCYYSGIELCIEKQLSRFDAGTQGEHKLLRGFEPVKTTSFHWIRDEQFHHVIDEHCGFEREEVARYIEQAQTRLPFKA